MNTTIFENHAFFSMRALVLPMLDRIQFRHHGIGVLQGYLVEGQEPELRIHIWSRRLIKPGIDESGDVHDHRFDMISHVLYGTVLHEEWTPREDPEGDHAMLALTHARAASETLYHGPTTALAGRYTVERKLHRIPQGFSYKFPAQQFHRSPEPPDDVAVTCIEKWQQREASARLLYPIAKEPVMAFGHTPVQGLIRSVIEAAKEGLRE